MQVCRTIADYRAAIVGFRAGGNTIGLVATMGALHAGHIALVNAAKADHPCVVATIFVNPTQFGDPKDLAAYPRTEAEDLAKLEAAGVAAVLIPDPSEIYPDGDETIVETTRLAHVLHGQVRPGHFRGVTSVVARLFNIAQPDAAYFGEKDYQQLQVIKRMTRDLHFPVRIVGVPTVREADGLAMSSRNMRLAPQDRTAALCLSRALDAAQIAATTGTPVVRIEQTIRDIISKEPRAQLRAVDIVHPETLAPARGPLTGPLAIMLSAEFGTILLIDQREIAP